MVDNLQQVIDLLEVKFLLPDTPLLFFYKGCFLCPISLLPLSQCFKLLLQNHSCILILFAQLLPKVPHLSLHLLLLLLQLQVLLVIF